MTEADLTAIEERNTRAIGFNHHALTDIPRLLSEVRRLQADKPESYAWERMNAAEKHVSELISRYGCSDCGSRGATDIPCASCFGTGSILEAKFEAAEERGAALEIALDHERTGRLQAEERVAELEALCQSILEAPPAAQRGGLQFEMHHGTRLSDVLRSGAANHRARVAEVQDAV